MRRTPRCYSVAAHDKIFQSGDREGAVSDDTKSGCLGETVRDPLPPSVGMSADAAR